MNYNLIFNVWKESPEPWNEREAEKLINMISGGRVGKHVKFSKFANITFSEDDEYEKKCPKVEELENFNKKISNCIVFDIDIPNCEFDKVFIYQYKTGIHGFSGYYVGNSKDESEDPFKRIHKYYIENDLNALVLSLSKTVYDLDVKHNSVDLKISPYRYHDRWAKYEYD